MDVDEEKQLKKILTRFKPYFELLPDGKVRCKANGHTLPYRLDAVGAFITGKKFPKLMKRFDAEQNLEQFQFISASKNFPNMLYCSLTGQLMDKSIEAAKKHQTGKKYVKNKEKHADGKFELKPEPDLEEVISELQGRSKKAFSSKKDNCSEDEDEMSEGDKEGDEEAPGPSKRARMGSEASTSEDEASDVDSKVRSDEEDLGQDESENLGDGSGEDFEFLDDEESAQAEASRELPKQLLGPSRVNKSNKQTGSHKSGVQRK